MTWHRFQIFVKFEMQNSDCSLWDKIDWYCWPVMPTLLPPALTTIEFHEMSPRWMREMLYSRRARGSEAVCGHVSYSSPNQCVLMRAQHGRRWSICATYFYMYYLPRSGLKWMANFVFDAICRWLCIPHNLYALEMFVTVVENYLKSTQFPHNSPQGL